MRKTDLQGTRSDQKKRRYRLLKIASLLHVLCATTAVASDNKIHLSSESTAEHTPAATHWQQERDIRGIIKDDKGNILAGVSVTVKNKPSVGTTTDLNGRYVLKVPADAVLVYTLIGFTTQEYTTAGRDVIDVTLSESENVIEETVVTAFGQRQRKNDLIGSVSSINPEELRIPSSNLTGALQGRVAGVISFQRSGEPGLDNADFFIRGVGTFGVNQRPLILIDNMEVSTDDLARIPVDDIASFSILRDATASAVYGSRGANGVILVTTKLGKEGKPKITFRAEQRLSSPTNMPKIADPVTFMNMHNEAVLTRNPLDPPLYSEEKIAMTAAGEDPIRYPAVDWLSEVTKPNTRTQNYNLSISGGGQVASYLVSGNLTQDDGLIRVNPINNFNNNVDFKVYNLRSNININVSKSTQLMVRAIANYRNYSGPPEGGSSSFRNALRANPALFHPVYEVGPQQSYIRHPLFGNFEDGSGNMYLNPYAQIVRGYSEWSESNMQVQIELKQDLSQWIEGLSYRGLANASRGAYMEYRRQYNPFYYAPTSIDPATGQYSYLNLNPLDGTEYLDYTDNGRGQESLFYMENAINYARTFNEKHSVTGMLISTIRNRITLPRDEAGTVINTLPYRNASFSGNFTYVFDNRYHAQFTFGYNGSEVFAKNHRWGFFPSAGVAWTIHNEKFMEPLQHIVSTARLRMTHGLVGNDNIHDTRFFYLSQVALNNAARRYSFGVSTGNENYNRNGVSIERYANPYVKWEISQQTNLGIDLGLFNGKFTFTGDMFRQIRRDIVQDRAALPSSMGLAATVLANLGKYKSQGFDAELTYMQSVNQNLWFQGRGTFTFAKGKYLYYEEPNYEYPYLTRIGTDANQRRGYIAERLFIDDEEVRNSPQQLFGEMVMGGDIKYLDVNGDGVVNSNDMVPIGFPTTPQINFGFGLTTGYKNFDFSFFFSGMSRTSLFINPLSWDPNNPQNSGSAPFGSLTAPNAVLQAWADSHWSEDNRDIYALWPRLSQNPLANNTQNSTHWMRNGAFLRLKQVELSYTLNSDFTRRYKIDRFRIYASGTNLFNLSSFDLWDPEMGGAGLRYPIQRVFNLGLLMTL
ncbi:SusC/RagA family TonB-linked outer membrane protein [Sphingobacterium paludis]|uniref:TonB-linked SusC/RagA family outer membrane protein n=1 Tax=Sphingobacterium paludis TaxID=1476465 RepID=A0A4R7CVK3_9SPHI|nr:TonB-dependent receptor [Sphingobacterium paludis]TDS11887.1 TonB-linked SusC/RagA family outer membrane protein [Sphingobacterium paludis]